jgi:hypothetical protein
MQPPATFVNCTCAIKITHLCERLGIPLLSFRHVPSVNHPTTTVVTLLHRKVGDPCCKWKQSSFICTNANSNSFVGVFVQSGKASMNFVMSICLPACISAAPNIRIYLKFDIRHFNGNPWRTNLIMIGQKYQALILILSIFHYCRRY